jgi:ABC-2 type transport system ATP-binding protein
VILLLRENIMSQVIQVKNLYKNYGNLEVLKGISFSVEKGSILALLGPNGAGKTTTVRILSTLLSYDKGQVTVGGFDVKKDANNVRRAIGLTGQAAAVDELLTGRENLIMMGQLYRLTTKSAKQRAQELLEEFDLVDAADRPAKTYSGGMRRRLDLSVSLIAAPPLIFLDEPTTGLDPRSRQSMWRIIQRLVENGTTILLTTQYLEEADQLADNIIVIDGGKIIAEGTAKELKSKVGKDRLELIFANDKMYKKATELISIEGTDKNQKELTLSIPIKNADKDVREILDKLASKNISTDSLAIHKPTLDDVFLSVTKKGRDE